ncbi:MAG: polyphosphate polymerase domain-containing protein [Planctomycetes bacterium]|nr:polyphosphate polymerase domain-containing protein [Planctomycetota bacterium]
MDTLHFERYEYKYFVPESVTDRVREFVRPYVKPDAHAVGKPGGRYTIHNIYLDTPGLDFFHAGMDDAPDRFKLRIRWYDPEAQGPFFFEVKRKIRQVIVKDRVRISRDELLAIVRDGPLSLPDGATRRSILAFLDQATCTGAVPTVMCRYTREPYESAFGEYARVTFDRAVCFQEARDFELLGNPRDWSYVDAEWATRGIRCASIIELKFTNEFPRWMSDLVAEFELERMGYSKYNSSIIHRAQKALGTLEGFQSAASGW